MQTYGLLGKNIAYSLSPAMHNAAFKELGLAAEYKIFDIDENETEEFFSKVRAGEISGSNVTIPYKEKALDFLEGLSPAAKAIGAVNTIVRGEGVLTGHNTDYKAFMKSLRGLGEGDLAVEPEEKAAFIFGSGGAAKAVSYGLLLLGVGLLFGAYLTLPMWVERDQTILTRGIALSSVPVPSWQHLLFWSNHWFHIPSLSVENAHWYGGYMGISLTVLALSGALCGLRWPALRQRSPWLAGAAGLVVALWLVFGYRLEPLRSLPVVQALSAARYLLFVAFFLALMVGVGAQCIVKLRGWNPGRVFSVLLLVVVVDLGSTTLQQPFRMFEFYIDELLGRLRQEKGALQEGELPGGRLLATIGGMHPYLMFSRIYFETGIPSPQADPGNLLKAVDLWANPFARFLNRILRDLHLAEEREEMARSRVIAAGLKLLNVRNVLAMQRDGSFKRLEWGGQSPVLVSPRIVGYPLDELRQGPSEKEIDRLLWAPGVLTKMERLKEAYPIIHLIEEMGVDIRENTCSQLLLADYDGADDLGTMPAVRVDEHQVRNQRVKIQVRVSADCYARLAYAYYPHLQVKVDDREVEPLQTVGGFICLPLEEGEHKIVLEARLSPLRRGLLTLDLFLLAVGIAVSVRERRR